jgi:hypothetical protein
VPLVIKSVRSLRSSVCKVRAPAAAAVAVQAALLHACPKHARSVALPLQSCLPVAVSMPHC